MSRQDGLRQRRRGGSDEGGGSVPRSPAISLETFDLYTKVRDEEAVHTTGGATVSLLAVLVCLLLVASELYRFIIPVQKEHMSVDPIIEGRLRINFDISFPALQCSEVNLDAMDVAGEQQNGLDHEMMKIRLAPDGSQIGDAFAHRMDENATEPAAELPADYCGSCYGAQSRDDQCCQTCDDVRNAYAEKSWDVTAITQTSEQCLREHRNSATKSESGEGCRLAGHMWVNKVAGNFHVAMGETHQRGAGHIHQFNPAAIPSFNVSHVIHSMSFGEPYPGIINPLDQTVATVTESTGVFMYFTKIIPTTYKGKGGKTPPLVTNQYSVTSQFRPAAVNGMRMNVLPGVFFIYELSAFQVTVTEHTQSLAQLVTSLCAILGGVITAAGLIDAALFQAQKRGLGVRLLSLVSAIGDGHAQTSAKFNPSTPSGPSAPPSSHRSAGPATLGSASPPPQMGAYASPLSHAGPAPAQAQYGEAGMGGGYAAPGPRHPPPMGGVDKYS